MLIQSAQREGIVNMTDKNQSAAAAVVQDQVRISDKARHIPGRWNFIRGIFTTISCQPTMTDRPGIPLITKLLQKRKVYFFRCLENHYICCSGHRNLKNEFRNVIDYYLDSNNYNLGHFKAFQ